MGSIFRSITRMPVIRDAFKQIASNAGSAAPAATATKPATGTATTAAIEDARRRGGRRRARRTGGLRMLTSQGNQGGDQKQTTLGPQ